jgi:hypothetical protein
MQLPTKDLVWCDICFLCSDIAAGIAEDVEIRLTLVSECILREDVEDIGIYGVICIQ